MPTILDPIDLLKRVSTRDAQGYARSHGWQSYRLSGRLMVFNRPEKHSLDQLLIPVDASRPDYAERMKDTVEKLAEFEGRAISLITSDLLNYDADTLRFRLASQRTLRGTIQLSRAIDLLDGAKQSLLSSAHSVLVKRKYHPKLSRSEALQFLDACQLGQTEQKSFAVAISCPMNAVDAEQAGIQDQKTPFARQATKLLTQALDELNSAIEQDRVNSVIEDPNPIVTANLCGALLKMRPLDDEGVLEFTPSWASSAPMPENDVLPASVRFSSDEFQAVEQVYRQLLPFDGPEAKSWIAFVDELKGADFNGTSREGEVVFTLYEEDELIRAKASLTAAQYQIAYDAHDPNKPTEPLVVVGQLIRGPRISRLTQITDLRPVQGADSF